MLCFRSQLLSACSAAPRDHWHSALLRLRHREAPTLRLVPPSKCHLGIPHLEKLRRLVLGCIKADFSPRFFCLEVNSEKTKHGQTNFASNLQGVVKAE